MNISRVRCVCGRVYEPAKHAACPECGAPVDSPGTITTDARPKATPPPPPRQPSRGLPPIAIGWQQIAATVAGLLVLIVVATWLWRPARTTNEIAKNDATPAPTAQPVSPPPSPEPTAAPTATPDDQPSPQPSANPVAPGDLTAIISNAAEGATIKLPAGVYQGGAIIARPVTLAGDADPSSRVIIQSDSKEAIVVAAKGVVLKNVQVVYNGTGTVPAIAVSDAGDLLLDHCTVQSNSRVAVSVNNGASLTGTASFFSAANGNAISISGARLTLADSQVSDSSGVGLLVGGQASLPSDAEVSGCRFLRNGTGIGVTAASSANIANTDCGQNNDGVAVIASSRVTIAKSTLEDNRGHGIYVNSGAQADLSDTKVVNNARGVLSGYPRKSTMKALVTMEDCQVTGNQVFGAGVAMQSKLILKNTEVDSNGKMNFYREHGAIVQSDNPAQIGSSGQSQNASSDSDNDRSSGEPATAHRRAREEDYEGAVSVLKRHFGF